LTFEIVCGNCGSTLYSGYELKHVREVLKTAGGRCRSCNTRLSPTEFTIEVSKQFT